MKFSFCEACPLRDAPGPVPAEGTPGGLVIIGEAPGREELQVGQPFVGRSGRLLKETLELLGDPPVFITNSVLCYPGKEQAPAVQAVRACSQRLWEDLQRGAPRALLLLGNTAVRAVLSSESRGILSLRGSLIEVPQLGVYSVPTLHPARVLRDPRAFREFSRDVEKVVRLLSEPPELPSPPEIVPVRSAAQLARLRESFREMAEEIPPGMMAQLQEAPCLSHQVSWGSWTLRPRGSTL